MSSHPFRSLKELLPSALARLAEESGSAKALIPLWGGIVGPVIAQKAVPASWEAGRLTLLVREPQWIQELEARSEELRERIAKALGARAPTKILFRLRR